MNWAWATSLDQLWRSPTFPMWLTLAAAAFFGILVLITLLRAEKSVANGALTVITLLAVGVAVAATLRTFGPDGRGLSTENRSSAPLVAALPALSCIDDLAGEAILSACEKPLFGAPETAAAALSYAAFQISRLTASGDVAAAENIMTPELRALRRAVERDRYGLMAYVLTMRDHCSPSDCAAFRSLTDNRQIVANMNERAYEGVIARYVPIWNAPPASPGVVAALPPSMPTGRPTNAEFPSAASTPPISIMAPEPSTGATPPAAPRAPAASPGANAPVPPARSASSAAAAAGPTNKQSGTKSSRPAAPVQLSPAAPAPEAPAPAADDE
ncbi:MAG: hypothetical protein NVSMB20_04060 [Bradyrhizobium sp.]